MERLDGRATFTIGVIADTHDVEEPAAVVAALAQQGCDVNVHLGDIGGSRQVMRVVREFKHHLGDASHLPAEQQRQFQAAIGRGASPLSAYIETRIQGNTLPERVAETSGAYRAVIAGMARLPSPFLLKGNVDGLQLRNPLVQACLADSPLELISRPRLIDRGWLGLLLWPSWRPASDAEQAELAEQARALGEAAARHSHLVVLAHEQLFKGPSAAVYTERVARAGLQQLTVPRFNPNPTWRCLLPLFRRLPPEVHVCYVFGHVHDTLEVIAAGAPALRNLTGGGLCYRLYGLAWQGEPGNLAPGGRRSISMLPVAVDQVVVLTVSRDQSAVTWRLVHV